MKQNNKRGRRGKKKRSEIAAERAERRVYASERNKSGYPNAASYGRKRSRLSRSDRKSIVRIIILLFIIIAVFLSGRELYWFATESQPDENNRYPVRGVDVSAYQKDIDWKGLESEGISFAFIKATEGSSHVDENFERNWDEAHSTDMKVGAYHFMSYDTEGETQAEHFIEHVDRRWGMLPPVVDVEFYGEYTENHPSAERMYSILDVILEKFEERYGRTPIIYTNTYIYDNYISGRYDDYPIWISDHSIPETLSDGRDWTFCQYTFRATSENVAGGEKYVDMNVFNGTRWEFRNYDGK